MISIYVGNLSFNTTESQLSDAFGAYGEVTKVNVVKDRETGKARGFAFVEMTNSDEARSAISGLNGQELGGRNLTCNEAKEKPARSSGGYSMGGHNSRGSRY